MEFTKLAWRRPEEAIALYASNGGTLPIGCEVKRVKPNRWVIASSEKSQIDCGPYSQPYDDSLTRYFTVLNDFVLAFMDIPEDRLVDFESVEVYVME